MRSKLDRNTYNIKINNYGGVMSIIAANLAMPFLHNYAKRMGAEPFHIGLITSLPALVSIIALLSGARFIDRLDSKKVIVGILMFCHRFFFLCFALVPILPSQYQVMAVVLLATFINLPGSLLQSSWQAFMGDLFDQETVGQAIANRNRLSTIFGIATTLVSGRLLSTIPTDNASTLNLYQYFFIFAFLISIGEVLLHFKIKERKNKKSSVDSPKKSKEKLINIYKEILQNKRFLSFAKASLIFHFGWQMGWPLFSTYQLYHLNADESWLSIITVASSASRALTYVFWNKFSRRHGLSKTLTITGFMMAATPFMYALSKDLFTIAMINILIGVSVAGFTMTLFSSTLEVVPAGKRVLYIALYDAAINISAFITPNLGIYISQQLSIYWALGFAGFFRLIGAMTFLLRGRRENRMGML